MSDVVQSEKNSALVVTDILILWVTDVLGSSIFISCQKLYQQLLIHWLGTLSILVFFQFHTEMLLLLCFLFRLLILLKLMKHYHLSACYRLTVQSMPVACLSTNRGYWVVYSLLSLYCMNNVVSLFNCFVLWIFYCFPNLLYAAEKPERWTFAGNSGGQSEDPRSPLSDRNTSTSVMYKADGKGSSDIRQEPRCEFL